MKTPHKLWAVLLLLAAVPVGFALGAWLGARLLMPDNAGLVGGAMVFWYGLTGLVVALVVAIVGIRVLDASRLKTVALVAAGLAAVLLALAGFRINQQQHERDAHRQQMISMLPPFELAFAGHIGGGLRGFTYASDSNDWRVAIVEGPLGDDKRCQGRLPVGKTGDRSRVALLGALRGLDVAGVLVEPPACQHVGEVVATLQMEIRESRPPATAGRLRLTQACRDQVPEIEAVFEQVKAVYRRHKRELNCR